MLSLDVIVSSEAKKAFELSLMNAGKVLTPEQREIAWQVFYPRWICTTRAARDAAGEFDVKPHWRMK